MKTIWIFNAAVVIYFVLAKAQDYSVRNFGAIGDGITEDTLAIRAAFQAAANSSGGRIIFDLGYTFLTDSFILPSNVIVDVQGKILCLNESHTYVT